MGGVGRLGRGKGRRQYPAVKAMDDCIVAYGQNGEPIRPQQGFPLRLVTPGFEGIYNTNGYGGSRSWTATT